jgi:hypothetical protein
MCTSCYQIGESISSLYSLILTSVPLVTLLIFLQNLGHFPQTTKKPKNFFAPDTRPNSTLFIISSAKNKDIEMKCIHKPYNENLLPLRSWIEQLVAEEILRFVRFM